MGRPSGIGTETQLLATVHCAPTYPPPLPTPTCAVGCILAELLQRKPLFPGKDYIDQLKLIIRTLVRGFGWGTEEGWGRLAGGRPSSLKHPNAPPPHTDLAIWLRRLQGTLTNEELGFISTVLNPFAPRH